MSSKFVINRRQPQKHGGKGKIQALEADKTIRNSSAPLFPSCLNLAPFRACLLNYEESLLCRVTTGMKWDKICTASITGQAHGEP